MVKRKAGKSKKAPQAQSEIAREKVAKAKERTLERAGTAILEGKPDKAKKILEGKKPRRSKKEKVDDAGAAELVADLRVKQQRVHMLDLDIECAKTKYAALKKEKDKLVAEILGEIGESSQQRLPFGAPEPRPAAQVDAAVQSANAEQPKTDASAKPADGAAPPAPAANDPSPAEVRSAGDELDAMTAKGAGIDAPSPAAPRAARGRGPRQVMAGMGASA